MDSSNLCCRVRVYFITDILKLIYFFFFFETALDITSMYTDALNTYW